VCGVCGVCGYRACLRVEVWGVKGHKDVKPGHVGIFFFFLSFFFSSLFLQQQLHREMSENPFASRRQIQRTPTRAESAVRTDTSYAAAATANAFENAAVMRSPGLKEVGNTKGNGTSFFIFSFFFHLS